MMRLITEQNNDIEVLTEDKDGKQATYIKGIFLQTEITNRNGRMYRFDSMNREVSKYNEEFIQRGRALGELGHPEGPTVNLDRVSHMITDMGVDGANGIGKLKILPTPMGNICKTLLESGVKLGVSSRGSGNVNEDGIVKDFEIITVDIVANPSAPDAYPDPIYERIMNHGRGNVLMDVASAVGHDNRAQRYLQEEVTNFIKNLRYRRD